MIQRIQTLWLLLVAGCMALCLLTPVAKYNYENMPTEGQRTEARLDLFARDGADMASQMGEPVVNYSQRMTGMETWPLVTLEVRIVALGFLLNVVYAFLVFFWAVDRYADLLAAGMGGERPEVAWQVGAFAPLASLVFFFLAQRAIKKDEALVRAADRLR